MSKSLQSKLLKDALVMLSLSPAEQQRLNGPGCLTCDMFEEFQSAWNAVQHDAVTEMSSEQAHVLKAISQALDSLTEEDCACFSIEAVKRPAWQVIRKLACEALPFFGWQSATVDPYTETSPGVWSRQSDTKPSTP